MSDPDPIMTLAARYVALWNEPDPAERAALVRALWAPGGVQVLVHPPQAIREAAANLAFPEPPLEVRGHDALEARVRRAHEMFVAPGEHVFAVAGTFPLLERVTGVRWSMVSTRTGEAVGGGLDVLALGEDGRIRTDHQFIG
ncbi:hypothetical protein [Nonomuraea sp. NPDC050783]|uniref:hypothetical protein n=1 Tax=Nonomuraea sp. NPDC050783 TaxID=3154634 RepID=UPI00346693CF